MTWKIGDRLYDSDWQKHGTVIDVDRYIDDAYTFSHAVITVEWDGGGTSDFTPDEKTRKEN